MRTRTLLTLAALTIAVPVGAQDLPSGFSAEVRPFVGAYVPAGGIQHYFETATLFGVQGAIEIDRNFHAVANASWTRGHNKFGFDKDGTTISQFDAGIEANAVLALAGGWYARPFVGTGAGGRLYGYRQRDVSSSSGLAGYGALGVELQRGLMALRIEGRDYVAAFHSPVTNHNSTRNDYALTMGLAYHVR